MAIDMDSFIVTTLERINDKMDKQDDKIDNLVEAVKQLIAVDIEIREMKESHKRIWKKIESIEDKQQNGGCSTFKQFVANHDAELKHNLEKIKECEDFRGDISEKVAAIEKKPAEKMDKIFTVVAILVVTAVVNLALMKIGMK